MFEEDLITVSNAAKGKRNLFKDNTLGYLVSSILAGLYIGLGIMLIFSIGGLLSGAPATKVVMGASFGVALSLVIFAGAELFTGNNFVMGVGLLRNEISVGDTLKVWIGSFIGNLIGSVIGAYIFVLAGLAKGPVGQFIANGALAKMNAGSMELFMRGILCNILVCLAVWCSLKLKSEAGKAIMIFWCLFVFITAGFEHSIANMTLLSIGLFSNCEVDLTIGGFIHNITFVTLGNIVGGMLLASSYVVISRNKK